MSKASTGNSWFCGNPDCWLSNDWTRDQLSRITVAPVAKERKVGDRECAMCGHGPGDHRGNKCMPIGERCECVRYRELVVTTVEPAKEQPVSETKLKPCPWCGGEAKSEQAYGYVRCADNKCRLMGPMFDDDGSAWNALPRRTDPAYPDGVVVFRRTGRFGETLKFGDQFMSINGSIHMTTGGNAASTHETLELIHPAPAPQRLPWPECVRRDTKIEVIEGAFELVYRSLPLEEDWCWHGFSESNPRPLAPGTYRRVTIGGADYAEREADDA